MPPAAAYESRTNPVRTCLGVGAYAPDAAYAISPVRRDRAYRRESSARMRVQGRSSRRARAYRRVRGVENSQETVTAATSGWALRMASYATRRGPAVGYVPAARLAQARPERVPLDDTARSGSPNCGTSRRIHGAPPRWQVPDGEAQCSRDSGRCSPRDTRRIGIRRRTDWGSRAPRSPLAGARTPGPRTCAAGSSGNGRAQRPRPAPRRGCIAGAAPVLDRRRRRASDGELADGSARAAH
jgi:hypothetical protein